MQLHWNQGFDFDLYQTGHAHFVGIARGLQLLRQVSFWEGTLSSRLAVVLMEDLRNFHHSH